jgi:hypothetical protein
VVTRGDRVRVSRRVEVERGETEVVALRLDESSAPAATSLDRRCQPNWYVDRDGIRRLRPECLTKESNPYR